jgi:tRNA(Ile)-lysidine synthase
MLRERLGLELFVRSVDHGLRPEAEAEISLVRALAADLEVPFSVGHLRVATGGNLMARARAARYADLEAAAERCAASYIVTAHHADDRAETVLLRILRGTTAGALDVLPARSGRRLRPMIRSRKCDVLAHLRRHRVEFACDPSNLDKRFLRVRVRLELVPLLSSLSPGIVEHLNALADSAGAEPLPEILDEAGIPLPLSRAQRSALSQLLARRSPKARVALVGGRVARLGSGGIVLESALGAAKQPKSD